MSNIFKLLRATSLFVILLSVLNVKSDDMVLPYDQSVSDDSSTSDASTATLTADQLGLIPNTPDSSPMAVLSDDTTLENAPTPTNDNTDPFTEVTLNPATFRTAKTSHTNLIIALTQQEQRDDSNQVAGGDINSGIMRNVEQGVLSNIAQPFTAPDDPSKIAFIRMDVKDNGWIWDYFNNGTTAGAQSVDKNNGTPQYLFFNQGNLVSVLIGNRDESAFAGWIRSNVLGQPAEPASNANPAPTAPTDSSSDGSDDTQI